jgi:hypothetical protein
MAEDKPPLSRYNLDESRVGTWIVNQVPGLVLTRRAHGWQMAITSRHPGLSPRAGQKGEEINHASKLLIRSGMIHQYFQTRDQGLQALQAALQL